MAIQVKAKVLKHFQFKKRLWTPGEEFSADPDDVKVLVERGKIEHVKPEKSKSEDKPV